MKNAPEQLLDGENRFLLSGASGMLGASLAVALKQRRFKVLTLVRHDPADPSELRWNPTIRNGGIDPSSLEGLSGAIHLSGANVANRRWTESYKREIAESRLQTTSTLAGLLSQLENPPPVLVTASAVGYYGDRGDAILDEDSGPGLGFFPDLCVAWEEASQPASVAGIRVVHPRFGVVLGPKGGALDRLRTLFRLGLGGMLGNGRQWMSWVSEPDAVASVLFAVRAQEMTGAFNVTSPQPVINAEFTRQLANILHRPAFLNAPAFALRLAFGEMADEALLSSTRAVPLRLEAAGFRFQHPTLDLALRAALSK